jgi:endonuclease/exonuclease/phosphatase family metal-dependent hydrolase
VASVRLLTYNILLGAERRQERITRVLKHSRADLIALQEVRDDGLIARLGEALGMTHVRGEPSDGGPVGLAVLSRLPIVDHANRCHPGMLRSHLQVTVEPRPGTRWRVHVVHLAARFGERNKGEARRLHEVDSVLADIAQQPPLPHILVGDFNSLTPGDDLEATRFLRRMAALRRARLLVRQADGWMAPAGGDGAERDLDERWLAHGIDPSLQVGIPVLPSVVGPLTALVPESRRLDRLLGSMVERWAVPRLLEEGYVDCFRRLHPRAHGYTCATWLPAARIDYVFASSDLAHQVLSCEVLGGRGHAAGEITTASDHFPLAAEIDLGG